MENEVHLKQIGFFRELPHGDPDGPSLHSSRRNEAEEDEEALTTYLAKGSTYIISPGPVWDVVDGSGPIGTATILTDGEWIWPSDLFYYLGKYHVLLDPEFVKHVKNSESLPEPRQDPIL